MPSQGPPPADALPKFELDLGPSADGSSFAAYRQNSAPLCAITLPHGASETDFWFKAAIYQLPYGMLFRATSAAHNMRRGPEQMASHSNSEIMMIAQVTGTSDTSCGGRRTLIGPGDIAFYDYAQGYETVASDFSMMALTIARDHVPPLFLAPGVHGAVLPAANSATQLLFRTMQTLFDTIDGLSLAEADAAIDAAFGMAGGALQNILRQQRTQAYGSGDPQFDRAMAFIDQNIADADLSPTRLEAQLGMSRSSLYRLFEPHGGVRAVVLRQRLDRAMKTLLTGIEAKPLLRKLAAAHGFASETHFSRAFRARFGITPRAFHDMVNRRDQAALSAQAQRAGFASLQAWIDHAAGETKQP